MPCEIRLTRIVATLGPATASDEAIRAILRAGVSVVRLNASHGTVSERQALLDNVRRAAESLDLHVGVLLDLCGPKIRVADMTASPLPLGEGAAVTIARATPSPSDGPAFSTTFPAIIDDCRPNQSILLDDGAMRLVVREVKSDRLLCEVAVGGTLQPRKGINLPDTVITAPALTAKDIEDLQWGLKAGVDYIGLSFVRTPDDVSELRRRIDAAGSPAHIVAKIEKPQAVAAIHEIIRRTDAIMVARGDLGVEMDVAEVPLIQKRIIAAAGRAGKPVITATQMLQSMIESPQPTRAEVSDVANAILDGTDAVMLSGETAVGRYPAGAVSVMDRVANLTEDHEQEFDLAPPGCPLSQRGPTLAEDEAPRNEIALADGAVSIATDMGARAIVVLTHSGATALAVSKRRPNFPIIAVSDRIEACRRMALYRGVFPVHHAALISSSDLRSTVSRMLLAGKWIEPGSTIVIISGQFPGKPGSSDMLQVHRVDS